MNKTFKQYLAEQAEQDFYHYSHSPDLTKLSGDSYGSGIGGAEDARVAQSTDPRIKKRVYFYPSVSGGFPRPETGLGAHMYQAKLDNLHDASKPSPEGTKIAMAAQERISKGEHPSNAFESSVLDAGYHGYRTQNLAVVLNKDVPVTHIGTTAGKTFADPKFDTSEKKKSVFDSAPNKSGEHTSSMLTPAQSMFWIKHSKELNVPTLRMEYGRMTVHKDHLGTFQKELEKFPNHPF
jgi:hypothetical protein